VEKEIIEILEFYFHGDCEFVAKEIIKKLQSKESDIIINATDSIAICGDGCCHTEGLHIWNGDDLLTVETDMKKETLVDILNHVGIKKIKQSKESDIPSDEEIRNIIYKMIRETKEELKKRNKPSQFYLNMETTLNTFELKVDRFQSSNKTL
jgi:hypothetical protein